MQIHPLENWQHPHDFASDHSYAEKGTARVMVLTAIMMAVEVAAGVAFSSMALLADGWHMATHVAAFGIALFAYRYARKHAGNPRFTFGTGKVSVLGGFASAVALAVVALMMGLESLARIFEPHAIHYNEAIVVAVIGLMVNLVSGMLLHGDHDHDHGHDGHHHEHDDAHAPDRQHTGHHHDHNLRAAYLHVLADALTSVLAIIALVAGKYFGWVWLDPAMGLVGAAVIARWSYGLVRDTSYILLDGAVDQSIHARIRQAIESDADNQVADLHVWYIGPGHYSASISLVTHHPQATEHYKALLRDIPRLSHVVIEVNQCRDGACVEGFGS